MGNIKRKLTPAFKAKVGLELLSGSHSLASLCSKYSIHPIQAGKWKAAILTGAQTLFTNKSSNIIQEKDQTISELYRQIGQLKVELDWLKKKVET